MQDKVEQLKVVALGDSGVGKTALVQKLAYPDYNIDGRLTNTIGSAFIPVNNFPDEAGFNALGIWDTGGQERFRSLIQVYCRNADVFLLCFDLTDKTSLDNLKEFVSIANTSSPAANFILVGTKADEERVVTEEDIEKFINSNKIKIIGAPIFTSASTGRGIDDGENSLKSRFLQVGAPSPKEYKTDAMPELFDELEPKNRITFFSKPSIPFNPVVAGVTIISASLLLILAAVTLNPVIFLGAAAVLTVGLIAAVAMDDSTMTNTPGAC